MLHRILLRYFTRVKRVTIATGRFGRQDFPERSSMMRLSPPYRDASMGLVLLLDVAMGLVLLLDVATGLGVATGLVLLLVALLLPGPPNKIREGLASKFLTAFSISPIVRRAA